jgi:hypothetical protein
VPTAILHRRFVSCGATTKMQGLIRWSNMLDSLATWEDLSPLQQAFPRAPVWGQPDLQGAGDVIAGDDREAEEVSVEGPCIDGPSKPRPRRNRKPNPKTTGPAWVYSVEIA